MRRTALLTLLRFARTAIDVVILPVTERPLPCRCIRRLVGWSLSENSPLGWGCCAAQREQAPSPRVSGHRLV
jgi:hypothetical protein